jgi:alpha-D-ribose 1-methylphosphonate 5-triphosphate diphosphatase
VSEFFIEGGRTVLGGGVVETSLQIAGGEISEVGSDHGRGSFGIDARGLLVLPGIVDLHGDAFERQMMPRPGVDFPIDVALVDSDRQAIGNGITTVFHATTWSWEPGLRSADNARHLRHETYNLDAEAEIGRWLTDGRVDLFAFNDHMNSIVRNAEKPQKRAQMVERCGVSNEEFDGLVARIMSRSCEVPDSVERLAGVARAANVRMLSHDDATPAMRKAFRAKGVDIAEFPVNEETAREAADGGDFIVFGAPNVVRGGSHTGWTRASDMIAKGLCSILASDYYYPAQLLAAFRLAADGVLPLARAWDLISAAPAKAAGLNDRGILAERHRADVILVDDAIPLRPRIVAVIAAGRLVHLTEASRVMRSSVIPRKSVAAA